ncbi:hypothetical protein [Streptomyces sp. NPDC023838]
MTAEREAEAAEELSRILDDAQAVLEPTHRHITLARALLSQLRR